MAGGIATQSPNTTGYRPSDHHHAGADATLVNWSSTGKAIAPSNACIAVIDFPIKYWCPISPNTGRLGALAINISGLGHWVLNDEFREVFT